MTGQVVTAFVMAAAVSVAAQRGPDPPMSKAAADEALNAMRVSSACADAAEKVWKINGDDKPSADVIVAHSSHYNRELKRCLILITTTTIDAKAKTMSVSEDVFDAIEQLELGSLFTTGAIQWLNRFDGATLARIPNTADNLAWFRNLMLK